MNEHEEFCKGADDRAVKAEAHLDRLAYGIVQRVKEPCPLIQGDAVDAALALIADREKLLLQMDALKKEEQDTRNQYTALKHSAGDRVCELERHNGEMLELLRQANELYTGYGLICGPIKDFPKYEGNIHQGEWIGKVRDIVRQSEKRVVPQKTQEQICRCGHPYNRHDTSGNCEAAGCQCSC